MAPSKVLLFGSGAVGTIYLHVLVQANSNVTAVCRSNYDAAKTEGFHIDSGLYGKGIHIPPSKYQVVKTPTEAAEISKNEPFDYILVCSKVLPDLETSKTIAPAVTEGHTTIVLIQNGIDIEQEYASRFPTNPLLTCVAYIPTTQTSPGYITHGDVNILEVGPFPTKSTRTKEAAETLISTLNPAGGNLKYVEKIQEKRRFKLLLNAPWNPICALTLCRDVAFLGSSDFAEDVIKGVLSEVVKLSQAQGFESVTDEAAEKMLEGMVKPRIGTIGIEPSMLVDVLWNRRMEVEVILGNPVKIAKRLGVDVPRMEMLYALTKALDDANRWRQPGQALTGTALKDEKSSS
ncbi:hypothetical protein PRZ48_004296 [Zasmidium cellare]|uniref:2-dehydropantoate 2-reductase n=1 Tax=Zasmidium cellare TaxID=395010 RepID=A0ABR0EQ51_ZASCE|nr:hypothetical protein PRZ48_004296 [Zasmidium cellare]